MSLPDVPKGDRKVALESMIRQRTMVSNDWIGHLGWAAPLCWWQMAEPRLQLSAANFFYGLRALAGETVAVGLTKISADDRRDLFTPKLGEAIEALGVTGLTGPGVTGLAAGAEGPLYVNRSGLSDPMNSYAYYHFEAAISLPQGSRIRLATLRWRTNHELS